MTLVTKDYLLPSAQNRQNHGEDAKWWLLGGGRDKEELLSLVTCFFGGDGNGLKLDYDDGLTTQQRY